jgi:probable phosphoglycerate mutase
MRGRLILVRHGESVGNATETFTDSPEVPLTELGRAQARESAELLSKLFRPVRLISSPFRRAVETAEIIAEVLALPIDVEPNVREQDLGDLHGQPYEAAPRSPGFHQHHFGQWRPPNGETLSEVRDRAVPVLARLARAHSEVDITIVCHGGTIRALWSFFAGSWEVARGIDNAEFLVCPHDGEHFGEPELLSPGGG